MKGKGSGRGSEANPTNNWCRSCLCARPTSIAAFRVGKAVYRGPAVYRYCFALVRPVLEGGCRGCLLRNTPVTEVRLISIRRPCRSLWMFDRWLTLS